MKFAKLLSFLILMQFCFVQIAESQEYSYYENTQYNPFTRHLYDSKKPFHTSISNYKLNEVNQIINSDSVIYSNIHIPAGKLNLWKRIFNEHLLMWDDKLQNISVSIDPLFNFEAGKEKIEGKSTFVNTRGFMVRGQIGKNVAFYADVLENQGSFPLYVQDEVQNRGVVPGQGRTKNKILRTHDYSQSTGYLSVDLNQYFNAQLGYGKNFIGDGYRSLILSDNSYSYPFFKFTTTFWNVKYQIIWAQMNNVVLDSIGRDLPFPKKWGVFHYLDWNVGKRFTFGFFENITWANQNETGYRGFDFSYAMPFNLFRPVEYANGSPDKVLVGANSKLILWKRATFYGQFVLNEFRFNELTNGKNWWANKYGFQIGFKQYNLLGAKNLDFQVEYNQVRPYTYSSGNSITSYSHHNQELAHPFGANFRELVSIANFRYHRWFVRGEIMAANWGEDSNDTISMGKDLFKSSMLRQKDYGNAQGQGISTTTFMLDGSLSYLINPRNNFNIVLGCKIRNQSQLGQSFDTQFVYFAIRTSLKNLYYDF